MFRSYLAAALRNLERNGFYAAVTVAGLAIGFAAAILIGLYVRHEMTYDQFIPGHDRIFVMNIKGVGTDGKPLDIDATSTNLADDLKLDFPQIQYTARVAGGSFPPAVRRGDVSVSERGFVWVDPDFFKIMTLPAVAGDPGTALEAPDALVLTRTAARKYFGRDAPIGGVLQVDGDPMRVAAVIEDLPSNTSLAGDVFGPSSAPFSAIKQISGGGYLNNVVVTYVRLKPGVSAASVQAAMPSFVARRIMPTFAEVAPELRQSRASLSLKPLTAIHLQPSQGGDQKPGTDVKVLGGIAVIGVLIVIVAAINFVTLMTARAARRAVEVGVRKAVGAERKDLIVQFMGEALVYVALALVLGVALAELVLPGVNAALQRKMAFDYLTDPALLVAMIGVAAATGILAGLYPALVLSSFRPSSVLKGGPITGGGGGRVRQALVVAQFAVLITLVLSTVTIYRQTVFALKDATHTNKDGVVMLFASPCTDGLRDAIAALPGVRAAACSSPAAINMSSTDDLVAANGKKVIVSWAPVDFGFFDIYGIRPVAGRLFQSNRPGDDGAGLTDAAPPIVLNESAVRSLGFASPQAAIGRLVNWHFRPNLSLKAISAPEPPLKPSEVIGVVPDFTFGSVRRPIQGGFFYVGPKTDWFASVALNIKLDPSRMPQTLVAIDRVFKRVSGGQPVLRLFVDQLLLLQYLDTVIQGAFIAVCAAVAVSIACLGLFALSAYTAERRTKEIGIRKAMGASSSDILRLLLWQFTRPVLLANLIAWPVGYAVMNWWLRGFAYHVDPSLLTFVAAALAAVLIALVTVSVQSVLVARAKPVTALRYE